MIQLITPKELWHEGQNVKANAVNIYTGMDDLQDQANVVHQLGIATFAENSDTVATFLPISTGNMLISGEDYQQWNVNPTANEWLVNWTLKELGLEAKQ